MAAEIMVDQFDRIVNCGVFSNGEGARGDDYVKKTNLCFWSQKIADFCIF